MGVVLFPPFIFLSFYLFIFLSFYLCRACGRLQCVPLSRGLATAVAAVQATPVAGAGVIAGAISPPVVASVEVLEVVVLLVVVVVVAVVAVMAVVAVVWSLW